MRSHKLSYTRGIPRHTITNNIQIWAQLGKCQLEKGEDEKARVTMERALQSNKSKVSFISQSHKRARRHKNNSGSRDDHSKVCKTGI